MQIINHICRYMFVAAVSLGVVAPAPALAATKEDAVKAGFIYNFTKFIVWPSSAGMRSDFHLCVIGEEKLGGSLEAIYGKPVGDRRLVLQRNISGNGIKDCHMVYIAEDSERNVQEQLLAFSGLPVLTVSDIPNFVKNGGMIGLIRDGNRVGFEINLEPANAVGIHMSSQLLKLAKNVKGLK